MAFIALIGAGLAEMIMVYCLKKANGFKNKLWTFLTFVFVILSLTGLNIAMQEMAMGIAYSIWVALGSVGSIIVGVMAFNEQINYKQILCMIIIIIAVIGLKIS